MDKRAGVSRISVDFFLSQSREKLRQGTLPCSRNFRVCKEIMDARAGVPPFSVEDFFVSQYRKTSWGALQYVRNFGVSKKFNA